MNASTTVPPPDSRAAQASDPAPARPLPSAATGYFVSVGTKGLMVFVALFVYLVAIGLFALHQKESLLQDFERMQAAIEDETTVSQAHVSIFHTIGALAVQASEPVTDQGLQRIAMHQQLFLARQAEVAQRFPQRIANLEQVHAAFAEANRDPSQAHLSRLITELLESERQLESAMAAVREKRQALSAHFRAQSNSAALTLMLLGALGLLLLGTTIGLFFRRLVDDLRKLQSVALETVRGIRGHSLAVTRHDEVGQLMVAVNSMADTLDQSARDLMLERQRYFHKEKMAAIGTLAAGIAHEIGNPIAAISGVAQEMLDQQHAVEGGCSPQGCAACHPDLILAQTKRLAAITREISLFAAPSTAESQWLDLNENVRSTARLIRYDKRLQPIGLQLELDSQLPALYGVADQITQLTMNLLINAMDALQGVTDRVPRIRIRTTADAQGVWLEVDDNGRGMAPQTLDRAFEAFFTTKAPGQGTGLGLSLCYSIVKAHGGTIDLHSTPEVGTQVQVCFPVRPSVTQPAAL